MPVYEYARPALTVDIAVFRGVAHACELLLVRRAQEPFAGRWALPGGFVEQGEPLSVAAARELAEETALAATAPLVQVGTYGDPGRDPRGWTVSVLFATVIAIDGADPVAGSDAADAAWHGLDALPPLAFDHDVLAADAAAWMRRADR